MAYSFASMILFHPVPFVSMSTITRLFSALVAVSLLPMTTLAQSYYQPYASAGITRAEFVRLTLDSVGGFSSDGTNCFRDVTNQYFAPQVCAAKQSGIVKGIPDGRFLPDQSITFIEAAAIVVRAKGTATPYDAIWYAPYLRQLAAWNSIPASVNNLFETMSTAQAQELIRLVVDGSSHSSSSPSSHTTDDVTVSDSALRLTVSSIDTAVRGDRVTFTIQVENRDNADQRVDIRAELDDSMTFVDATRSGDDNDTVVEWDNLLIRDGDTEDIELTVRISNTAWVNEAVRLRVYAEDLHVTRSITVENGDAGDISLSISDSDDPIERLGTITYRIRIKNNDNDDLTVNVRALLDASMDYVSATDDGSLYDDSDVRWEDIDVQEDETKTILLTVRLNSDARDGDTLSLRVDCEGQTDTETTKVDDPNNTDSSDYDVSITTTDSPDPAEVGDIVRYRITIRNNENSDISLDVTADLDTGMTYYSSTQSGRKSGDIVRWDALDIAEDETKVLLLDVRINSDVDDGDTVRLRTEGGDETDTETTSIQN